MFWRFSEDFRPFSEDFQNVVRRSYEIPNVFQSFLKITEDCRGRSEDVSIKFGLLSIETASPASWLVKNGITHVWISFFSICYHSLYHYVSLYNKKQGSKFEPSSMGDYAFGVGRGLGGLSFNGTGLFVGKFELNNETNLRVPLAFFRVMSKVIFNSPSGLPQMCSYQKHLLLVPVFLSLFDSI